MTCSLYRLLISRASRGATSALKASPRPTDHLTTRPLFARGVGGAVAGGKGGAEEVGRARGKKNEGQQKPSKGPSSTVSWQQSLLSWPQACYQSLSGQSYFRIH